MILSFRSVSRRTLAALFFCSVGLNGSAAFAFQHPLSDGATRWLEWPAAASQPTRTLAGDVTGDQRADSVTLTTAGAVRLDYGVSCFRASGEITSAATDIALIESGSLSEPYDLLVLDGQGLTRYHDYSINDDGQFVDDTVNTTTPWLTAERVVVGDVDDDGDLDAVGVGAGGTTILVSSDFLNVATAPTSFSLPYPVLDLLVVDWSPAAAIVAVTTGGLYVRRWDGTVVTQVAASVPYEMGALARIQEPALGYDRVAVVYRTGNTQNPTDLFVTIDKNGLANYLILGYIDAYGICSGDVDGDGLDDVVLAQRLTHEGILLLNDGGTFGFGGQFAYGTVASAALQTGQPALADFTNDGDIDFLIHTEDSDELVIVENNSIDHSTLSPDLTGGVYDFYPNQDDRLGLDVASVGAGFTQTHVECSVWVQEWDGTDGGDLAWQAIDGKSVGVMPGSTQVDFMIQEDYPDTSQIYYITMRAVEQSGGVRVAVGPTAVWAFATDPDQITWLSNKTGNDAVELSYLLEGSIDDDRIVPPGGTEGDDTPKTPDLPDPAG